MFKNKIFFLGLYIFNSFPMLQTLVNFVKTKKIMLNVPIIRREVLYSSGKYIPYDGQKNKVWHGRLSRSSSVDDLKKSIFNFPGSVVDSRFYNPNVLRLFGGKDIRIPVINVNFAWTLPSREVKKKKYGLETVKKINDLLGWQKGVSFHIDYRFESSEGSPLREYDNGSMSKEVQVWHFDSIACFNSHINDERYLDQNVRLYIIYLLEQSQKYNQK